MGMPAYFNGVQIRAARALLGWTQRDLASAAGVSAEAVSLVERGIIDRRIERMEAAVALFVSHYNLCRVHETIRMTPAMALGVADHIWTIGELVEAALGDFEPPRHFTPFTVIQGGLSDSKDS